MSYNCKILVRAVARLCALAMACAAPLLAQTSQSTVPHPPDTLRPQSSGSGTVPHPPDLPKRAAEDQTHEQTDTTIRVNVKLVNVFATVTDGGGSPVSTLKQE